MRRSLVIGVAAATLGMVACGNSSRPVGQIESNETAGVAPDGTFDANAVIDSAFEVATGQRGEKENAPGALRVNNLLVRNGAPIDIDVYWGLPDEGEKAATVAFGQASDYLVPRRAKGAQDAVFTITVAGKVTEELMTWDRWSTSAAADRTTATFTFDGESVSMAMVDESPATLDSATNEPMFPAATSGKVRLRWWVLGNSLNLGDALLSVTLGGKCLTNGSSWADLDGNALFDVSTVEVPGGSQLGFAPTCDGAPVADVAVPANGRAILFAYSQPDGSPALQLLPVTDS